MIDLRSDTVTRPSAAMRQAMANAEVGDDVFGEDPTAIALQEIAKIVGKESALFVSSGTMGNELAIAVHTKPGDEVIASDGAHVIWYESGGAAALSGVQMAAAGQGGLFTADEMEAQVKPGGIYWSPQTSLVCVENTHNRAGGRIFPQRDVLAIAERARARGLALHLDGARIWNASVATGLSVAELAAPFDTVSVCFSKGLGAPIGSALVGPKALLARAHRLRKMWGGGMRQIGILAAAARYALANNRARLADDHANAKSFAERVAKITGAHVDVSRVDTNIVNIDLDPPLTGEDVARIARTTGKGLAINATSPRRLRAVTHLDVSRADVEQASDILADAIARGLAGKEMRMRARVCAAALLVLSMAACAPNRGETFARAFAEAERAQSSGLYEDAARRYDAAALGAKLPHDRDHARFLAAMMLAHAGLLQEATARLDAIAKITPATDDSARAAYKAADIRISKGDDAGWRGMDALVRAFPSSGVSRPALYRFLRRKDEMESKEASIAYLRALTPSLGDAEIGEELAYQIALRMNDLGQSQAARDAFVGVATRWPYPGGALFDDALYRASEIDEKLGRYADMPVADLERMLDEREIAHLTGSYERPRYGASMMRIAVLYRDRIKDREKAREAFHRLYVNFTTSPLRDDALWSEAEMWREDGDTGAACDRLATLAHDFPDSRYVPCAAQHCPRVTRPEKSKAPKACHAYLEKLRPEAN